MTFKEVLERGVAKVIVTSYGYVEKGYFFSHYEPFGNRAREFTFEISGSRLTHGWLKFEHPRDEHFEIDENGVCTCFDPDLYTRVNW